MLVEVDTRLDIVRKLRQRGISRDSWICSGSIPDLNTAANKNHSPANPPASKKKIPIPRKESDRTDLSLSQYWLTWVIKIAKSTRSIAAQAIINVNKLPPMMADIPNPLNVIPAAHVHQSESEARTTSVKIIASNRVISPTAYDQEMLSTSRAGELGKRAAGLQLNKGTLCGMPNRDKRIMGQAARVPMAASNQK